MNQDQKLREAAEKAAQMLDDLNSAYGSDEVQKVADDLRTALLEASAQREQPAASKPEEKSKIELKTTSGIASVRINGKETHTTSLVWADVTEYFQSSKPEPQAQAGEPDYRRVTPICQPGEPS